MLHLLHPAFVHFSVAFLIFGGLCESLGLLLGRAAAVRLGQVGVVVGTISLLPTLYTGYLAANVVGLSPAARRTLDLHELNGWLVLGLYVALLFWKAWNRGELPQRQRALYAAALLVGVALAAVSAFLGGELVYIHGVGVAR